MASGALVAIAAYLLSGGAAVVDKILLGQRIPSAPAYAFYVGVLGVFAFALATPPTSALGQVPSAAQAGQSGGVTLDKLVTTVVLVVNWFSWFVGVVAVVMGLYAGFLFMTARGEPATLSSARKTLIWAVVGIAVAILAFGIISITSTILGL